MLPTLLSAYRIEKWNTLAEKQLFPLLLKAFFLFMERFSIASPTFRVNGYIHFAEVQTRALRAVGVLWSFLPSPKQFVLHVSVARPEQLPVCRKGPG